MMVTRKPENREGKQDIENDGGITSVIVSHVLTKEKKLQMLTLRRLGWSLRRIEKQTRLRLETAANYLKAAGIAFRPPGAGEHEKVGADHAPRSIVG